MPAVDFSGKILLETQGTLALSPDGHGGSLRALERSGSLDLMASEGIDTVSYFQVDNPLVRCIDPAFIGWHLNRASEMSSKTVLKAYPEEKLGHFCILKGKLVVIEYSDLPESYQRERDSSGALRYAPGSIAIHILDREFVRRMARGAEGLPFHRADKKIATVDASGDSVKPAKANGLKFELFVFDALPSAKNPVVVETNRADDFSPVKNAEGVDSPATCRADQLRQFARWLRAAGADVATDASGLPEFAIEVSPLFGFDEDSFAQSWSALSPKPAIADGLLLRGQETMTTSDTLQSAVRSGELMPDSAKNIAAFLGAGLPAWAEASIGELVEKKSWAELNDRFYRSLEFGTGGIRGRTIASTPTAGETGTPGAFGTPEHAASGATC